MGWFDEQIKQRKQSDNATFSDAFINIAGAVMGEKVKNALNDDKVVTKNAIGEILKYYHVQAKELPDNIVDMNDQLEYMMRPHGIMQRTVKLTQGWYKDAIGAMLCRKKEDGSIVALIPSKITGYHYVDPNTKKSVKITHKNEETFEDEAIAFYLPFPLKKLSIPDLMQYIVRLLSLSDFLMIGGATLALTLVGMLMPKINNLLFSTVIASQNTKLLLGISIFSLCTLVSSMLMSSVKSIVLSRINTKLNVCVQGATMMRVMSLPVSFFREYSSGELSSRAQYIGILCNSLVDTMLTTGLTSVFSLAYISQIFIYAKALVLPSVIITLATLALTLVTSFVQMKISKKTMELGAKESGLTYALISGVQKIKLSGAEKRAFSRWGNLYAQSATLQYNPPMFLKINSVFSMLISLTGAIVMYVVAISSNVTVADYYSFNTAYGMVSGAFMELAGIAIVFANIKPIVDMAKPILENVPEVSEGKRIVTRVSGNIELNNVEFRYNESMPLVLDDISLKIKSGEYVAIVGKTGCGKSTLMRLLLGFEVPQKGSVYYDGNDLNGLDVKSLRKKIGVVMQNGKLFMGDIYSNIVISAPWLTLQEAWEAAELTGLAEDIRHMPMGMHTIISEGSGGISGGQRQRVMIARAIAPKPKILMLDEATSALDNLTQKLVSDSLEKLKCTRIVIAHRLSTIKHCDRIIVLDKGKIIEDGTYEQLIDQKGFFSELVERQRLDLD